MVVNSTARELIQLNGRRARSEGWKSVRADGWIGWLGWMWWDAGAGADVPKTVGNGRAPVPSALGLTAKSKPPEWQRHLGDWMTAREGTSAEEPPALIPHVQTELTA